MISGPNITISKNGDFSCFTVTGTFNLVASEVASLSGTFDLVAAEMASLSGTLIFSRSLCSVPT